MAFPKLRQGATDAVVAISWNNSTTQNNTTNDNITIISIPNIAHVDSKQTPHYSEVTIILFCYSKALSSSFVVERHDYKPPRSMSAKTITVRSERRARIDTNLYTQFNIKLQTKPPSSSHRGAVLLPSVGIVGRIQPCVPGRQRPEQNKNYDCTNNRSPRRTTRKWARSSSIFGRPSHLSLCKLQRRFLALSLSLSLTH